MSFHVRGRTAHTRALAFFSMALLGEIKRLAAATAAKQINLTTITVWRPPIDAKSRRHGTDHARESGGKICIHSCSNMFLIHATLDPPFWTSLLKEVPSSLLLFCLVAQKKPMSSLGKWWFWVRWVYCVLRLSLPYVLQQNGREVDVTNMMWSVHPNTDSKLI